MSHARSGPALRVAFVSMHGSPLDAPGSGSAGGMSVYVREVARALAREGTAVDVLTCRASAGSHGTSELAPVRVVPLAESADLDDAVRALSALGPHELVHTHYWRSGALGAALADALDVPLVHTSHSLGRSKARLVPAGAGRDGERRVAEEERTIDRADAVVVSTAQERRQLRALYATAPARTAVVPPGVDHRLFAPAAATRFGEAPASVVAVGRIDPVKGLDLTLEALARLRRAEPRASLDVVGGPSGADGAAELERLRALVRRLRLRSHVRFLGPQPHATLSARYRRAGVLAVSSLAETFGLVALEAQACGTRFVGTPVGALPELAAGGGGMVVRDRDPEAFAAALGEALAHRSPETAEAALRSAGRYSWAATACATRGLYDDLVGRRG